MKVWDFAATTALRPARPEVHNRARYQRGCRCDACTGAERAYRRRYREARGEAARPRERMRVTCWCEATVVTVPRKDVLDGLTASCGAVGCG